MAEAGDGGDMWSKLPLEVMPLIFCKLSVFDIVRAGCTCKLLKAFISSLRPLFLFPSSVSLFVFISPFDIITPDTAHLDSAAWVYDRSRDVWPQLSLSFLEPILPGIAYPVASAGGLLCIGSWRDFVICNPLTRSCRRLPTLPLLPHRENAQCVDDDPIEAFGLMYNSIAGTYDFFILHHSILDSKNDTNMMHYSSLSSEWKFLPPLVMSEALELHGNAITPCGTGVYTVWEREDNLVVFSYCNGSWIEIEGPEGTSALLKGALLDVCGSLHMVGGVGSVWLHDDVWERPTSIRVWKLHAERMEWMEVTRMPALVLQEFHRFIILDDLQCWGKDGVMYMKSNQSNVLTCDLATNEWRWLLGLDLDVDLGSFTFEPSLSAST